MSDWDKDTLRSSEAEPSRGSTALQLAVLTDRGVLVHPLPHGAVVTFGRSPEATITLDDREVSRLHLEVRAGAVVEARDLGSSNGTRFRGRTLAAEERVALSPGDSVELGSTLVVLQTSGRLVASTGAARDPEATVARAMPRVVIADPAMRRLAAMIERVAPGMISVLLLGETGVGKEIFAELVHRLSPRASGPFLRLNCAALAEQLLESELFGHEKGAFTGAVTAKPGLLETAEGGTVFLDEVGELPASVQVKLLRVLEERKVSRVGALKPRDIDVRIVAATHRDLRREVDAQRFREDLYFRINGITLDIPPLRERPGELEALARYFLAEGARRAGLDAAPPLTSGALDALRRHDWPGNLRELRNVLERAVLLAGAGPVSPEHVVGLDARRGQESTSAAPPPPPVQPEARPSARAAAPEAPPITAEGVGDLREQLAAVERQRILDTLERCGGNQTLAAKILGIPRRTFINRLEEYGVSRPRKNAHSQ
ncbi:MAG: sigma 54-interacting transcriptional regulator [Polyangiales bacterium]